VVPVSDSRGDPGSSPDPSTLLFGPVRKCLVLGKSRLKSKILIMRACLHLSVGNTVVVLSTQCVKIETRIWATNRAPTSFNLTPVVGIFDLPRPVVGVACDTMRGPWLLGNLPSRAVRNVNLAQTGQVSTGRCEDVRGGIVSVKRTWNGKYQIWQVSGWAQCLHKQHRQRQEIWTFEGEMDGCFVPRFDQIGAPA
jgi:hypothetical protein